MKTKKSISDDVRAAIELRAYYIWEHEGRPEGRGAEHWALAEAGITSELIAKKAVTPKTTVKKTVTTKKPTTGKPAPAPIAGLPKAEPSTKKSSGGATRASASVKSKKAIKPKTGKSLPRA